MKPVPQSFRMNLFKHKFRNKGSSYETFKFLKISIFQSFLKEVS